MWKHSKIRNGHLGFSRTRSLQDEHKNMNRFSKCRIHFAVGLSNIRSRICTKNNSTNVVKLAGGNSAAASYFVWSRLSFLFPMLGSKTCRIGWTHRMELGRNRRVVGAENLHPAKPLNYLHQYLLFPAVYSAICRNQRLKNLGFAITGKLGKLLPTMPTATN